MVELEKFGMKSHQENVYMFFLYILYILLPFFTVIFFLA